MLVLPTYLDCVPSFILACVRLRSMPGCQIKHTAVAGFGRKLHMVWHHACRCVTGLLSPPSCRACEATLPAIAILARMHCSIPRKPSGNEVEKRVGAADQWGDSMAVPDYRRAALVFSDVVDVNECLDSAASDAMTDLLRLPTSACG